MNECNFITGIHTYRNNTAEVMKEWIIHEYLHITELINILEKV